jgi:hypothetical protein
MPLTRTEAVLDVLHGKPQLRIFEWFIRGRTIVGPRGVVGQRVCRDGVCRVHLAANHVPLAALLVQLLELFVRQHDLEAIVRANTPRSFVAYILAPVDVLSIRPPIGGRGQLQGTPPPV